MKKIITIVAACMMMITATAQNESQENATVTAPSPQEQMLVYENPKIPIYLGEITYQPMTTGQQVKNALTGLLSNEISVEDESMVAGAKEALMGCLNDVNRFVIKTGKVSAEDKGKCLVFSAKIIFCNFTEKLKDHVMDKEARIVAYITLTNPATNQVVYSNQVTGCTWLSIFNSMAECRQYAQNHLWVNAASSLRHAYPLRGHMLEKGFQKGKKQKLKEFYIDLGSDNRLFRNSQVDVYVVKRIAGRIARQYIGSGTVLEVQGPDISICKVTKNGDLIKQSWDRGAEIAIQAY